MINNKVTYKEKIFPYWRTKFISYFDIGEYTVKIDLSTLTARESVYVDNVLVSKKQNLGQHSIHSFSIDDNKYELLVDIKNSFTGPIDITLRSKGIDIDGDHWVFPSARPGLITGLLFAAIGFFSAIIFNTLL